MLSAIEVPAPWRASVETIVGANSRRVLVLGATDAGKSTYCTWLCSQLSEAGRSVALVDADVGQKAVGPPAAVSLAYPARRPPASLQPGALAFVGAVNPVGHFLPLILGTRRLVDRAEADVTVVDTAGLVQGPGWQLQEQLMEALRPDRVLALQRGGELESLLHSNRHRAITRLPVAAGARRKSDAARRAAREARFRDHFADSNPLVLDLDEVVLRDTPLLTGTPATLAGCTWAESTTEGLLAVAPKGVPLPKKARRIEPGFERDRLCGLGDASDDLLGLGIVEAIDFAARRIRLDTPVSSRGIKTLRLGELRVRKGGQHQRAPW